MDQEAAGLEEGADLRAVPADNFFEDGHEHGERVGAEHGARSDVADMLGLGDGDGEAVARVHVEHDVDVGSAVAGVDDVIRANLQLGLQLVEDGNFAVARGGAEDGVNLAGRLVAELGAENVIRGDDAFERGVDHFDRSGRKNVKIKIVAFDAVIERLVEQADIVLQANALADLVEMLAADAGAKFGIVQQQVSQFGTLLDEIEFGHAARFALEFVGGNADEFAEDVAGVVEGERLVEVARE